LANKDAARVIVAVGPSPILTDVRVAFRAACERPRASMLVDPGLI